MALINTSGKIKPSSKSKSTGKSKRIIIKRSGEANLQEKTVTENGDVTPDEGYNGLSKVTVNVSGGSDDVFNVAFTTDSDGYIEYHVKTADTIKAGNYKKVLSWYSNINGGSYTFALQQIFKDKVSDIDESNKTFTITEDVELLGENANPFSGNNTFMISVKKV